MAGINDFGVRISRFGFDVKTAADFQLIFNSSWPALKIGLQGSFTWTAVNAGPDLVVATHGLGYNPVFQVFNAAGLPGAAYYNNTDFYVDNNKLYVSGFYGTPGNVYTVYYYIYRQSATQSYTSPNVSAVAMTSGGYGPDYGFKISKVGKSIYSTDLRDYVVHSGTQELTIAQVVTTNVNPAGSWTLTHNLGYKPAWLFFKAGSIANTTQAYNSVRTTATNSAITFTGAQSALFGIYSAVIFKDPVQSI